MKFLVILLALIINHYWTRDRDVLNDKWFVKFQGWLAQRISGLPAHLAQNRWLYPLLVLALPTLTLGLLLLLIDGVALGLMTLVIHIAVLLALFDHVNVNGLTARYLESWRRGDYESAFLLLQQRWHQVSLDNCDDRSRLHEEFCRFLLSSFFERLFAVLFWYLLLGPVGALFYHLGFLYRSRESPHSEAAASELVLRLVYLLEWVPARLLGLTFSLAGDFVAAFARLRAVLLDLDRSAVSVVYACALAALGSAHRTLLVREEAGAAGEATTVLIDAEDALDETAFGPYASQQIEAMLALLNRSQVIWVSALALLALYGIDS
ncbi:MAG: regulatory signaling modulator protein AmpE [Gammaproteobacteria bacterium]|nr:regulatory signaling modulator protein AmpE [Gammaproteobacteria bacterium]